MKSVREVSSFKGQGLGLGRGGCGVDYRGSGSRG